MILETAMSANGALSFGISVYENVAKLRGILTGNTVTHRLERIERSLGTVQRIEEHLARSSLREVAPVEGTARPVEDLAALTAPARRVQAAIGADLIQSAAIEAPEPLLRVFAQNPEDLLHAIRPLASDADLPQDLMADPTMVPVVFERWGAQFVGWTRRGTLSLTLGTDYTSRVAPDILGQARTASPPPEAEAGLSAKELFDRGFEADGQQDYAEAMRWYRRAAEKGHAKAMNNIGVLYDAARASPPTLRRRRAGLPARSPRGMITPRSDSPSRAPFTARRCGGRCRRSSPARGSIRGASTASRAPRPTAPSRPFSAGTLAEAGLRARRSGAARVQSPTAPSPSRRRGRHGSRTGGDLVAHCWSSMTNGRSGACAAPPARRSPPPRR